MPHLEFFVVSESVSVDQITNRVSVFNILDRLVPQRFPALLPKCVAVCCLDLDEGEVGEDFQAMIRITTPEDEEVREFRANFRPAGPSARVFHRFAGIPVRAQGTMRFEFLVNNDSKATHRITVEAADPGAPSDGTLVYHGQPAD